MLLLVLLFGNDKILNDPFQEHCRARVGLVQPICIFQVAMSELPINISRLFDHKHKQTRMPTDSEAMGEIFVL